MIDSVLKLHKWPYFEAANLPEIMKLGQPDEHAGVTGNKGGVQRISYCRGYSPVAVVEYFDGMNLR